VGYEINKDYLPVIKEKLGVKDPTIDFEVLVQKKQAANFKQEIARLPYIFKDPVKFDKKVDPKKLRFGSKIDHGEHQRETYHSIKNIISPEMVVLDNGLKVRLLGVKENKKLNGKATEFLAEKLKGQKVFMRYDNVKHDKANNLFGYLYLKNKTFINAHLIKTGFAYVDTSVEYRYKKKFIALENAARSGR
jgi:site-specific DNA-methyltransferase (adenine-specific)